MIAAERPPPLHILAEFARVAAVSSYGAVSTPLDALTPLVQAAAACMGRTMAALALVESDRVCFGPAVGMDIRCTQRAGSFWHAAIAQADPLVVTDALGDARFHDHPMTQGLAGGPSGVRFYAGVPLLDGDGYRLGTLCALDRVPGEAGPAALAELSALAEEATRRLEAHREAQHPPAVPAAPAGDAAGPAETGQAWLGVRTKSSGHPARAGLIVLSVAADSPAYRAALRPLDVLVSIDGQALHHPSDVTAVLAHRPPHGSAVLRLMRAGHMLERSLQLEPGPPARVRSGMALRA